MSAIFGMVDVANDVTYSAQRTTHDGRRKRASDKRQTERHRLAIGSISGGSEMNRAAANPLHRSVALTLSNSDFSSAVLIGQLFIAAEADNNKTKECL